MARIIQLYRNGLDKIRTIDERLVSYNIEMTELTGGTFWKEYTPGQIAGTEEFPPVQDFRDMGTLMQHYPPVDLSGKRIRSLSAALGSAYIRVSGSWATDTYYDFDGHTGGIAPEGYKAVLNKEQWDHLLDFVKAVNGKLLVSVSNCPGDHVNGKPWTPQQAKLLFDYSREYGVPIAAAEFMNEPNVFRMAPPAFGYDAAQYGRDQDEFYRFIRSSYPEVLLAGPCACADAFHEKAAAMAAMVQAVPTEELLSHVKEPSDVFSYHCYAGLSERGAAIGGHWTADEALSEAYLDMAAQAAAYYAGIRDRYYPGAQMWVTESADAGLGGNTWASTFLDIIRYADELGRFSTITDGIIFHNTLASSDYGLLDHETHLPRPNYWLAYLWNQLVGSVVYDTREVIREGAHVYAHSRKDGEDGYTYIIINNSRTAAAEALVPSSAELYLLDAKQLRAHEIRLNGEPLEASEDGTLPEIKGQPVRNGKLEIPPASVTFVVL